MREFTVTVVVRAGSRTRSITVDESTGIILVKTPTAPERGKANKAVVDILAEHFRVPKSQVSLIRGSASRRKIFKIMA